MILGFICLPIFLKTVQWFVIWELVGPRGHDYSFLCERVACFVATARKSLWLLLS